MLQLWQVSEILREFHGSALDKTTWLAPEANFTVIRIGAFTFCKKKMTPFFLSRLFYPHDGEASLATAHEQTIARD
jgi:hypothetical protein